MLRTRSAWLKILLLALSPLAGWVGAEIWSELTAVREIRFEKSRREAIQIAQRFAQSRGISTQGWRGFAATQADDTLHSFYRAVQGPQVRRVRRIAPEVRVQSALVSEDGKKAFEVELAPDGRVVGFLIRSKPGVVQLGAVQIRGDELAPEEGANDPGDEAALQVALDVFQEAALPEDPFDGKPEIRTERQGETVTRKFVWRSQFEQLSALKVRREIQVDGSEVVSDLRRAEVDEEFAAQNLQPYRTGLIILQICLALGAVFICFYSFIRYVRRAREKEVSHQRSFVLGSLVAVSFSIIGLLIAVDSVGLALKKTTDDPLFIFALLMVVLSYVFMGLLIGVFWGSSEGDVRESFPGKLTSLDALMVGKIFSGNVAWAVVSGAAVGAWALLASGLVQLPWAQEPTFGGSLSNQVMPIYASGSWLVLLLAPLLGSVPTVILGLLLPLAFSYRHFSSRKYRLGFLGALTALGCSSLGLHTGPFPVVILMSLTMAAVLLFAFYFFDLLTAMAALSAQTFMSSLVQISGFTSFAENVVWISAAIVMAGLVVQLLFAWRGQQYTEAEVRPLYAEHAAQRRALEAEVSAAREAQLRLSPQQVPRVDGLSLAASCRPARIVGGDFFDFFQISRERLGIFFAEGGGSGLSAALSIAFAKGLLIPMVKDEASPSRIVARLCEALGPLMTKNGDMGVLYAVVDTSNCTLRWARVGNYPKLVVCSEDAGPAELEERSAASDPAFTIHESDLSLKPHDKMVFFTDGIARALLTTQKTEPETWIADFLASQSQASAEELHRVFTEALDSKARGAPEDDLASIFLKFHGALQMRREEVA